MKHLIAACLCSLAATVSAETSDTTAAETLRAEQVGLRNAASALDCRTLNAIRSGKLREDMLTGMYIGLIAGRAAGEDIPFEVAVEIIHAKTVLICGLTPNVSVIEALAPKAKPN
jgi:hypothetical protein